MSGLLPFQLSRTLRRYPVSLLGLCLLLLTVSFVVLRSASMTPDGRLLPYLSRQALWAGVGLLAFGALSLVPYDRIGRRALPLYLAGLVTLGLVFVIGTKVNGARRWFSLGSIRIQPSEMTKYVLIVVLAHAIAARGARVKTWRGLAEIGAIAGVPFLMVAAQPDLGTSLTYVPILVSMLIVAGMRWRHLMSLVGAGLAAIPVAWLFLLKDYQKDRVLCFLDPEANALGGAYQTTQSLIAIGAGGAFGRGFLQGTQGPLGFVPERHTDFIFAVICEDFGLLGGLVVLALYAALICTLAGIARRCRDLEGRLLVIGVLAITIFQVMVNVGMATGVAPVTGLTLPLVSYGGSSLVSTMIGFGLAASVATTRPLVFHSADREQAREPLPLRV
ncbi:MAG: rod shape-determining protein RodA [Planctomycetota bacterium]